MGAPPKAEAANENLSADQDALSVEALARGVLAREIRPRAGSIRRLAEAVIALQAEVKAAKKVARKARKAAKAAAPAKAKKNKKLVRIPGQKKGK